MSDVIAKAVFHAFQILLIYTPGAATIPASVILFFANPTIGVAVFIGCLGIVAIGFWLRPKVACLLGLDKDYE